MCQNGKNIHVLSIYVYVCVYVHVYMFIIFTNSEMLHWFHNVDCKRFVLKQNFDMLLLLWQLAKRVMILFSLSLFMPCDNQ